MRFLNSMLLAGLALAALPIIIHLINRKRAVRIRFPAIEFLLRSERKMARRLKAKQLLLLLFRVLLLLALPLAMARPYLLSDAGETADERLPASIVFVFDDSYSMGHTADAEASASALDRARDHLIELLDELRPWDQVALVWAHSPPEAVLPTFSENHQGLADVVSALEAPSNLSADLPAALALAREIQSTGQLPTRRTILISDDTASSWQSEVGPESLVELGPLELHRVRSSGEIDVFSAPEDWLQGDYAGFRPESTSNIAIVSATFDEARSSTGSDYALAAVLRNYDERPRVGVQVDLILNDTLAGSTLVDLDPGSEQSVSFTVDLGGAGLHRAEFALTVDGPDLEADNHYYMNLHLNRRVRALLVNGDPRTSRHRDELFYFERALNTGPDDRSAIDSTIVGVDGLGEMSDPFGAVDVVVLANVDSLPRARIVDLTRFVNEGGGLLISMGDQVDPERYNDLFGELLPKPLRSVRELCEPGDADASLLATRVARVQPGHPIFRAFELPGGESIQSITVYSYMLLEPSPVGRAEIIMSYSDGGPAVVEREVGAGRVALLTTTIDREWTDLPIRTAFLPLSRRLVRYLARRGAGDTDDVGVVGERLQLNVESQSPERVTVTGPSGARHVLTTVAGDTGVVGFTPEHPGHYVVELDIANVTRQFDELMFAANLDRRESDMRPAGVDEHGPYHSVIEAGLPDIDSDNVPERRVSLWPPILFLVIVLLFVESGLSARRRMWQRIGARLRRS